MYEIILIEKAEKHFDKYEKKNIELDEQYVFKYASVDQESYVEGYLQGIKDAKKSLNLNKLFNDYELFIKSLPDKSNEKYNKKNSLKNWLKRNLWQQ